METLIYDSPTAELFFDKANKLAKAKWIGDVEEKDFRGLIITGAQLVKVGLVHNLYFDRRELGNFTTATRVWLKEDFMKNDGAELIQMVEKIAAVDTKSVMGQMTAAIFSKILLLINPQLNYRVFGTPGEADRWIKSASDILEEEEVWENDLSIPEPVELTTENPEPTRNHRIELESTPPNISRKRIWNRIWN